MIKHKTEYYLENKRRFVIENYNWSSPFANFFPCIAGKFGIPMWIYYINRGQGICSMGVKNKDHQIMEFLSFNKAIQLTENQGYRTFIKCNGKLYEPFKRTENENIKQKMIVSSEELKIIDINEELKIQTEVTYFMLTGEKLPGLIRKTEIKNLSNENRQIELIDGLVRILPYGTDRDCIKVIARHIEGMMQVYDINDIPVYKLKIDPADKPEISILSGGNFYLCFDVKNQKIFKRKNYIIDPGVIFKEPENYDYAYHFKYKGIKDILEKFQINKNRTPCAFTGSMIELEPQKSRIFYSIVGYGKTDDVIKKFINKIENLKEKYFIEKQQENTDILEEIKGKMLTVSASDEFNEYCHQTFLDNILRGGMPAVFDTIEGKRAFYLYSRQNGDLERDYHNFVIEPTYYSQGNSHYRCVVQNRRSDIFFEPEIDDFNIAFFLNLMQLDGYNPIEIQSTTYTLIDKDGLKKYLLENNRIDDIKRKKIEQICENSFMPGKLAMLLDEEDKLSKKEIEDTVKDILKFSKQNSVVDLHPRLGFWVDQWSYNTCLIETYLRIFPDKLSHLLTAEKYTFFDNCDFILPRHKKYILVDNKARQYEAVERDLEYLKEIGKRKISKNCIRTEYGKGEVYKTNLSVKLLVLIANRVATLDPENLGLELEANKPGWNDSINGLPGILGSSLCQTFELIRACNLLKRLLETADKIKEINIFEELYEFIDALIPVIDERLNSEDKNRKYIFWDKSHNLKEKYRERTRRGISGNEKKTDKQVIINFLEKSLLLLKEINSEENREKAYNEDGVPYTYLINDVIKWEETGEKDNKGNKFVKALAFKQRPVSLFLEGPTRYLKISSKEKALEIYNKVKKSELYDRKLKTYKNCESLEDETFEIGRIKAWSNGWLEYGSLYTHMLYKYLLGIISNGLYDEFFEEIKYVFMPFLDPRVYKRSIFENVSFIVSSAFIDETMHGQGFQARLSGSTCEMIDMWTLMCCGKSPFFIENNKLQFSLKPILKDWMFTKKEVKVKIYFDENKCEEILIEKDCFAFKLFSKILVIYKSKDRRDTFNNDIKVKSYKLIYSDGKEEVIEDSILDENYAKDIRDRKVKIIYCVIGGDGCNM